MWPRQNQTDTKQHETHPAARLDEEPTGGQPRGGVALLYKRRQLVVTHTLLIRHKVRDAQRGRGRGLVLVPMRVHAHPFDAEQTRDHVLRNGVVHVPRWRVAPDEPPRAPRRRRRRDVAAREVSRRRGVR